MSSRHQCNVRSIDISDDYFMQVTKEYPLLINCTVHRRGNNELVILGGGGNLFSFGTCLNHLATVVSIS